MPFILDKPLNSSVKYSTSEKLLSKTMVYYWSNFIKYNDPNYENKFQVWPKYKVKQENSNEILKAYIIFNIPIEIGQSFKADYCAFWNVYIRSLTQNTSNL